MAYISKGPKPGGGSGQPFNKEEERRRMRLPKEGEVMGIVMGLMGGSRMKVACKDGKERMCRIPGKLRNKIWVKDGDVVIVKPWEIQGEIKGDIIWRYFPLQAKILKEEGHI
ncbi:translation initiation factor eIF-1A [Candidatus Micrarchaeota archaeon]|nr:translation initiation factor eIF-1A [Candidatus Micrarchaeota archaeon]